jgi:hypothetical protein
MSRLHRTSLLAVLLAAPALAAGCGGSQIAADEVPGSPPALTVPSDTELGAAGSNADATSGSNADESADSADGGASADGGTADSGTAAPEATATPAPAATRAPEDSTGGAEPPPAGSTPEQFENFCEQNAGAC